MDKEITVEEKPVAEPEKKEEVNPNPQDLVAKIAAKDAEISKLTTERDNYKTGLLKAKGKLPGEESEEENLTTDEKIQKAVQDALYSEKEKKLQAEKEELNQQLIKENAELKTALANKTGMTTVGTGTSADTQITTPQFFSDDQVKELKARGWDDAKIKKAAENMQARR